MWLFVGLVASLVTMQYLFINGNPTVPGIPWLAWHNVPEVAGCALIGVLFAWWADTRGHPVVFTLGLYGIFTACILAVSAGSLDFVVAAVGLFVVPGVAAGLLFVRFVEA